MNNFIYSSGGALVDDNAHPTKLLYGDPRVVKAMQLTQNLQYKYNVSPDATFVQSSGVSTHDLFAQGHLAMYVSGIWEVPRFREEIGNRFDWDIGGVSPRSDRWARGRGRGIGICNHDR